MSYVSITALPLVQPCQQTMAPRNRNRLFIDFPVQGALLVRSFLHWAVLTIAMAMVAVFWTFAAGGAVATWPEFVNAVWMRFGPSMIVLGLLAPIFALDLVRLSHRFAGPILRLRGVMREGVAGRPIEHVQFREGDFWHEFADEFNTFVARLQEHGDTIEIPSQQSQSTHRVA